MMNGIDRFHDTNLQDIDLLGRLDQYFDSLQEQLRWGTGWFIFNAGGKRGSRIVSFVLSRAAEFRLLASYYFVPWRDFSLTSYMVGVELQSLAPGRAAGADKGSPRDEYAIASRVSQDAMVKMVASDLLIIAGLKPTYRHEVSFLEETITRRYDQRLATILLSPYRQDELAAEFRKVTPEASTWEDIYRRMYERSLIAA